MRSHDRLQSIKDNNELLQNYEHLRLSRERLVQLEDLKRSREQKSNTSPIINRSRNEDDEFAQAFQRNELLRHSQGRLDELIRKRRYPEPQIDGKNYSRR